MVSARRVALKREEAVAVKRSRIDRRWSPDPLVVAGHSLRPVVRISGYAARQATPQASGGGVRVSMEPLGVNVQTPDGRVYYVDTPDATAALMRRLLLLGLAVTAVAWTLLFVRRLRS